MVKKTELAKSTLGGIMIWEMSYDTQGDLSLMKALYQTLEAGNCPVTTFFRDEDGDGFGNMAKPFQACEAPEGYVANMDDKDDTKAGVH